MFLWALSSTNFASIPFEIVFRLEERRTACLLSFTENPSLTKNRLYIVIFGYIILRRLPRWKSGWGERIRGWIQEAVVVRSKATHNGTVCHKKKWTRSKRCEINKIISVRARHCSWPQICNYPSQKLSCPYILETNTRNCPY